MASSWDPKGIYLLIGLIKFKVLVKVKYIQTYKSYYKIKIPNHGHNQISIGEGVSKPFNPWTSLK